MSRPTKIALLAGGLALMAIADFALSDGGALSYTLRSKGVEAIVLLGVLGLILIFKRPA